MGVCSLVGCPIRVHPTYWRLSSRRLEHMYLDALVMWWTPEQSLQCKECIHSRVSKAKYAQIHRYSMPYLPYHTKSLSTQQQL